MTMDTMSKLNTVFKEGKLIIWMYYTFLLLLAGTVTAGNASGFFSRLLLLDYLDCFYFHVE
jgi:acetyl-CoA acetyltransferase